MHAIFRARKCFNLTTTGIFCSKPYFNHSIKRSNPWMKSTLGLSGENPKIAITQKLSIEIYEILDLSTYVVQISGKNICFILHDGFFFLSNPSLRGTVTYHFFWKLKLSSKVRSFKKAAKFKNLPLRFDIYLVGNLSVFFQIVWPSQNIWIVLILTWVNAEHSTYLTARNSFCNLSPCSIEIGFCLFFANLSMVAASSLKSICVPTSKNGVFWQWCEISGTHCKCKKDKVVKTII